MNAIATFDFEDVPVRTVEIDGEPWFIGSDVCRCLSLTNPSMAMGRLADDERREVNLNTLSTNEGIRAGNPNAVAVNEPGVYRLIFESRKPEAERFRRWVFHDVLPSIRRTGRYTTDWDWEEIGEKLRLVKEARLAHGRKAAREMWARLGLPAVEEDGGEKRQAPDVVGYLNDFLEECTEEDSAAQISAGELYRLYSRWATQNKAPHFTMVMFGRQMSATGIRRRKTGGHILFIGRRVRFDVRKELDLT